MATGSLVSASTVSSDFSFGSTSFRDLVSGEGASVKLEFSEAISEFSFGVSRVRADEFLTHFNSGTLSRSGLNAQLIEFDITTANGGLCQQGLHQISCH